MPLIPPADGPFAHYFQLRAHRQFEPFQHGSVPQADREDQVAGNLDIQAVLRSMPARYAAIVTLLSNGRSIEEICEYLGVSRKTVQDAKNWYRNGPPIAPPPDDDPGSINLTL